MWVSEIVAMLSREKGCGDIGDFFFFPDDVNSNYGFVCVSELAWVSLARIFQEGLYSLTLSFASEDYLPFLYEEERATKLHDKLKTHPNLSI